MTAQHGNAGNASGSRHVEHFSDAELQNIVLEGEAATDETVRWHGRLAADALAARRERDAAPCDSQALAQRRDEQRVTAERETP